MKKYGIVTFNKNGFTLQVVKRDLEPEKASRIFEKFRRNGRGVIACLEGAPIRVEYTSWALGDKPGVHDIAITETETLTREELFDLFPDLGSWTQRVIARSNECSGVCY